MPENTVKHKFVIDKWKRNGKVVSLRIRKKKEPSKFIFFIKIDPPIPDIEFKTPDWVKDFVYKMNIGEIRLK